MTQNRSSAPLLEQDAAAYRFLEERITATMPEPSRWDGDAAAESLLADYVDDLAEALKLIADDNCGIGWSVGDCLAAADAGMTPAKPDMQLWCARCVAIAALRMTPR